MALLHIKAREMPTYVPQRACKKCLQNGTLHSPKLETT